jgi:tetratricopeptide (TPR) repeat protein
MSEPSIEYYNAAIDAVEAGKIPEALSAVESSLTEDPRDAQTWQLYVVILDILGRREDAAKATAKLKEIGLGEVDELLLKAAESVSNGDLAAAISCYEAALELDQSRPEIHASYALTLMETGNQESALAVAERAVALAPEDAHANYALGHILRLIDRKEAALVVLSKSVSIDPGLMIALYEHGMLLAEAGRLPEALANFEKYLVVHPGDSGALGAVSNIKEVMKGA